MQEMGSLPDVELSACGLPPSLLNVLLKAGFRYKADVKQVTPRQLSNETGITFADASTALNAIGQPALTPASSRDCAVSAFDLLKDQQSLDPVSTLLPALDEILGGGYAKREITELCGAPGTGKTQLGLHACLAAQCQFSLDSADKAVVIYIDTEGSFVIDRVAAMAESLLRRRPDLISRGIDRDELLRGITYFRAHDFVEQLEIIHSLSDILHLRPQTSLVVVDSIAFHFRHGFEDFSQRARALDNMASMLQQLAVDFDLAVLVINQVTSRAGGILRGTAVTVPALGESWSHSITNRVLLTWEGDTRAARVTKSSSMAQGTAYFDVTSSGIENVEA